MSEPVRAYIYRVLTAISVLVMFYGVASERETVLWLGVANAVLGNGLASMHTSTKSGDRGQVTAVGVIVAAAVAVLVYILLEFVVFHDQAAALVG